MKKNSEASAPQSFSCFGTSSLAYFLFQNNTKKRTEIPNQLSITRLVCNKLCYISLFL